ncbi:MAG: hypothetical protein ABIL58_26675 [Pseudomonadota bacterium]
MGFESGGMADKLGNRYEARWVAKQLLRLLNEEIQSVTVEPIGPEGQGVDLTVIKKDGVRQLQQCKARLGSQESWSVKALASKGILSNLQAHLERDPLCEFALVSAIPSRTFADICESARFSNDNPVDFLEYQILKAGKGRQDAFKNFCGALSIAPVGEELQDQFAESIQHKLIGGRVIPREETAQVIESINAEKDVILHGAAGFGKSGVLYELTEYLQRDQIPYLPIRLDRRIPEKTATHFGADMGLPDSPAFAIAGLAAERKSILIIDQLDAIRWTTARSSAAMDVCKELIRQVRSLRQLGKSISIIFACRSFDLEHDSEYEPFLKEYIRSQTFADEPLHFILSLEKFTGSLLPVSEAILGIGDVFSTTLRKKTQEVGSRYPHVASKVPMLLVRLYEQAQDVRDAQIVNQCLDRLDQLFENRVGRAIELTRSIER